MMEVFVDAEGTSMYLTGVRIDDSGNAPLLILRSDITPPAVSDDNRSYEEQLDEQKQKAMHMGSETERATKMHPKVE